MASEVIVSTAFWLIEPTFSVYGTTTLKPRIEQAQELKPDPIEAKELKPKITRVEEE